MALLSCNEYLAKCEGFEPQLEPISGPVLTVPDDALTIIEIIQRYSRGIPLPWREGLYDEDSSLIMEDDSLQILSDVMDKQAELAHEIHQNAGPVSGPSNEAETGSKPKSDGESVGSEEEV